MTVSEENENKYVIFCLSVCLSFCVFVSVFVSLSVCLSVCLCMSVCLSVCLSDCLSDCPSVCLSVYLTVYVSVHLTVCLSVCLSIWLSICLCAFYTLLSYIIPLDLADHLILFNVFSSILNILIPDTPSETKMAKASSWFTRKEIIEENRKRKR